MLPTLFLLFTSGGVHYLRPNINRFLTSTTSPSTRTSSSFPTILDGVQRRKEDSIIDFRGSKSSGVYSKHVVGNGNGREHT